MTADTVTAYIKHDESTTDGLIYHQRQAGMEQSDMAACILNIHNGRQNMPSQKKLNAPSLCRSTPPPNTVFFGSTPVDRLNGISIGSAVLAQLMVVTNRQTDGSRNIGNNRQRLYNPCMRGIRHEGH